ncbi:cell division protein FtsQ/DivIB [Patescibacteria group bacterium]|nr:FtsQ-type POTRA domain-containing protein [Candidatus Falkowbacteria bacterium]MBU3905469.1 cell division protein FtsQ/DivIB [Patescibacteria group bacterium]MBU4015299.1 cell division protein FtsQ/DivIB [Patescibacteria group bacterium]MBU4026037.1 cell division protein FtsQ/DivIB [Patescibacteria group bacterium]MBU4073013.1 cell division protein FtsQ/DivIB [Patescibacteria group bacterium]
MLTKRNNPINAKYRRDRRGKRYSNPFFGQRKRKKIKINYLTWKIKLIALAIILLAGAIAWFLLFSNYFNIKNINVSANGSDKAPKGGITDLIWIQTANKRFLLGSQSNIFLFNISQLSKKLNEQYNLDELKIEKKLPNTFNIILREKNYSAVWQEADKYYYIDNSGNAISEANPLEIKKESYPLIQSGGDAKVAGKKIESQNENIDYIIKLFYDIKNTEKLFTVESFIVDDEVNTVKMAISQGPKIYFNTEEDTIKQINKLYALIKEKLKDDFLKKEYIDLRYGDRVYYR